MNEATRIPGSLEKSQLYEEALTKLRALLDSERDPVVIMASVSSVLHTTMPHYFWTGFYRVAGEELVIGPYQGTPGCLRIGKGKGGCGTAWERGETIIVEDVHAFPGHIACDSRSKSEIVVPWKNDEGEVIAVLDVDSTLPAAFDEVDAEGLSTILGRLAS